MESRLTYRMDDGTVAVDANLKMIRVASVSHGFWEWVTLSRSLAREKGKKRRAPMKLDEIRERAEKATPGPSAS
jgi:hypothetical protein